MRSSREDLRGFPDDARSELGQSLYQVQCGERPDNERPLHGDLAGVSELKADSDDNNTYRVVFTLKLGSYLFVLHCFQKKSKTGIATPKRDWDVVRKRLKEAKDEYRELTKAQKSQDH